MCMFCRSLFVLLYFFFWQLCFRFFFDLRILISPLVSSNSSLKLISSICLGFWLCLVDVFFNRQSAFRWEQTVLLYSLTCSFIREWASEWLLLSANSTIFQLYQRKQVNVQWDDNKVRFALDQHAELDVYSAISLKQQSADRHVAPFGHIILIRSQPVFVFTP